MAGYMTYWPQDRVRELQKAGDTGPILAAFGSIHSRMPSIASVKVGDILYPVSVMNGTLCVLARLPVEKKESAYDYLVRELGNQCGALVPDGVEDTMAYYATPLKPHKEHQRPFNCCSKHAVSGSCGSSIAPRPLPEEILPALRFGPKGKEKGIKFLASGAIQTNCLVFTRRLSDETFAIFEALFQDGAEQQKGD